MNLNKVFVLGNLTRDPERRSLPSGQPVVSFGLATNRYFTKDGKKEKRTEFHNITAFGKLAETADQYLNKGSLALIEGRLRTNTWEDKNGNRRSRTEIIALNIQLGPRRKAGSRTSSKDDDIPVVEDSKKESPKKNKKKKSKSDSSNDEEEIDVDEIPF